MRISNILKVLALAGQFAILGCGSSSSSSGNPLAPDTAGPGPSGATITIGANGVTPKSVTISVGQSVTFLNGDNRPHTMTSDPHPSHTQCPAINAVDLLSPGQSKLTNALSKAVTCGFHDHNDPSNASLQGSIIIQ